MARRRRQAPTLGQSGLVAAVLLTIYGIANPTSLISIIFVLVLIALVSTSLFVLGRKLFASIKDARMRSQSVDRAESVYRTPHGLTFLTPREFEHYVANVFEKLGFTAQVTPFSQDGGIDVVLKRGDVTTGVQVKKWKENVGRPEIQRLVGAGKAFDNVALVTNSYFTNEARTYAKEHGVMLIVNKKLEEMAALAFGEDHIHLTLSRKILGGFQRA